MSHVIIQQRCTPLAPVYRAGNVQAQAVVVPIATVITPTGDGIIDTGGEAGHIGATYVRLIPFGVGDTSQTFVMGVFGWQKTVGLVGPLPIWVPVLLGVFSCSLFPSYGVQNSDVGNNNLFCGTIVLSAGNLNVSIEIDSANGAGISQVRIDHKGSAKVQVMFGTYGGAQSANALYALL